MIYQGKAKYPVREAVLHTSATPKSWAEGKTDEQIFAEIRRWHVEERGWREIGYHFVIMPGGARYFGRDRAEIGAHVQGHNRGTIGICMVGPGTPIGQPEDHYTEAQIAETKRLLAWLSEQGVERVTGHNDHAARDCPGFRVRQADWMPT